jgi:hypothetical protein
MYFIHIFIIIIFLVIDIVNYNNKYFMIMMILGFTKIIISKSTIVFK